MKNLKSIYTVLGLILLGFNSCEVAKDIDDFEPLFTLDSETAIRDEASAELALAGAYAGLRNGGDPHAYILPSLMSNLGQSSVSFAIPGPTAYNNNNPIIDETDAMSAYQGMYAVINRSNWIIEKVAELEDELFSTPTRRTEIIGEAKTLRALAHFYVLRLWGEFYDISSGFGIDVRTTPARSAEAFARKTVAETYAAIIRDLDDAIATAPDLRAKFFANKNFAKGLKARILLYQGEYAVAAALAKEVIDDASGDFELTATFEEQFDNTSIDILSTSEVLFGTKGDPVARTFFRNLWGFYVQATQSYIDLGATGSMMVAGQDIAFDNTRISSQFEDRGGSFGWVANKFANRSEDYDMIYHMRMAEVYLIHAEALARATNTVSADALASLNAIRIRAGAITTGGDGFETYPVAITLDEFLEAVRIEKSVELGSELGEEWFDLIRYDFADGFGTGFQVSDFVPTATDPDKFILPISTVSIAAGGNLVVQNPGY